MTRLIVASLAASTPMGQQAYENQIAGRAAQALGPSWQVDRVVVRTLRTPLSGTVRVPKSLLGAGSPRVRRLVGRAIYRSGDVVHRLDLRLPPAPAPEILTVHDLAPWRFDDEGHLADSARREAARAEVVICPSQFAADEVAEQLGIANTVAIPNGVDDVFFDPRPLSAEELHALGVRAPFVLHAGGCTRRKNLTALAEAWPLVKQAYPDLSLVFAGPPDRRRQDLFAPLTGTVLVGRVAEGSLPGLMAAAEAVVVPSIYEGFGLPAAEAMAAGTPVVASARSSLPEVCGPAGILVEPTGEALAAGLISVVDGHGIAERVALGRVKAAEYTWARSAERHAEVWRRYSIT